MFDTGWIDDLDGDAACDAVAKVHRARLEAEAQLLALAAQWADLYNGNALDALGVVLPGMEHARRLGGPGTPRVLEFCTGEFGALQDMGYVSAANYLRDALDLRHRHPLLWAAIRDGGVRVWQGREVAKLVHAAGLSAEQARWVDAETSHRLVSLPWGRFLGVVQAKIIEADPDAAEARRVAAALERFVRTGQCNEYGLKTIIAKGEAGDVIFFVAMCDRIAQILALTGDSDPVDVRRSKAVEILANPARALALLQDAAAPDTPGSPDPVGHPGTGLDPVGEEAGAGPGGGTAEDLAPVGEADVHPRDNDADDADDAGGTPGGTPGGAARGGRVPAVFTGLNRIDRACQIFCVSDRSI